MNQYFKEYFVCPHCGKPIVSKIEINAYIIGHGDYCSKCGKNIADALAEATATDYRQADLLTFLTKLTEFIFTDSYTSKSVDEMKNGKSGCFNISVGDKCILGMHIGNFSEDEVRELQSIANEYSDEIKKYYH